MTCTMNLFIHGIKHEKYGEKTVELKLYTYVTNDYPSNMHLCICGTGTLGRLDWYVLHRCDNFLFFSPYFLDHEQLQ
jgi:hypothetical protein